MNLLYYTIFDRKCKIIDRKFYQWDYGHICVTIWKREMNLSTQHQVGFPFYGRLNTMQDRAEIISKIAWPLTMQKPSGVFTPEGFLVRVERFERSAPWTQITCATNCATPGYSVFLHDTTRGRKKQVSRVCGRRCGQARFCGSFSSREFPPQATVPRTSGISLLGEWIGRLSSQSKCLTDRLHPDI